MTQPAGYRLINACFASLEEADVLLQAEPALLEERTGLGETALHYLAVEDCLVAVRWLIDRGASVNVVNDVGTTPLSDAASLGHRGLVELLLERGARCDLPNECEPTLVRAARSGDARVVELLLAAGAQIDDPDEEKEGPLHAAVAAADNIDIVAILLQAGARIDAKYYGETAEDVARRNDHLKVAEALASHRPQNAA